MHSIVFVTNRVTMRDLDNNAPPDYNGFRFVSSLAPQSITETKNTGNGCRNTLPMSQKPLPRSHKHKESQNRANRVSRHAFYSQSALIIQCRRPIRPNTHVIRCEQECQNEGRRQGGSIQKSMQVCVYDCLFVCGKCPSPT